MNTVEMIGWAVIGSLFIASFLVAIGVLKVSCSFGVKEDD